MRALNHPSGWGFDDFAGFLGGMHDYFDAKVGTHYLLGSNREYYMPVYQGTRPVKEIGYMTDWISEQAVQFVQRHGPRSWPYFLYLSYTAIHSPDQATNQYLERNGGDVRRAMLDAMDGGVDPESVGPVRQKHAGSVSDAVGWVMDITEEDAAAPEEFFLQ